MVLLGAGRVGWARQPHCRGTGRGGGSAAAAFALPGSGGTFSSAERMFCSVEGQENRWVTLWVITILGFAKKEQLRWSKGPFKEEMPLCGAAPIALGTHRLPIAGWAAHTTGTRCSPCVSQAPTRCFKRCCFLEQPWLGGGRVAGGLPRPVLPCAGSGVPGGFAALAAGSGGARSINNNSLVSRGKSCPPCWQPARAECLFIFRSHLALQVERA